MNISIHTATPLCAITRRPTAIRRGRGPGSGSVLSLPRSPLPRLAHIGMSGQLALALLLTVVAALGSAAPASAAVLVSNIGQSSNFSTNLADWDIAQGFTTGSNATGYTLTNVELQLSSSPAGVSVKIVTGSANGAELATLTAPATLVGGINTFTAPADTTLSASTTYFLIIEGTSGSSSVTSSDNEDSGAAAGWSIGNSRFVRSASLTSNFSTTDNNSSRFRINGTAANSAPTVANAIPDQPATIGAAFSYAFPANTFADADTGDTLAYTATKADGTALPGWLNFTASTRTFSGTPQASDAGTVSVKVTASDGTDSVSDTFDITVSTAPAITGVAIVSKPRKTGGSGTRDTYGQGQNIAVEVTWNKDVTWDVSAANAGIGVRLRIGTNNKRADLVTEGAQSGTARRLRFLYTVATADADTDGVAVMPSNAGNLALLRNGATLKIAGGTVNASVKHAGLGAQTGHLVDGSSPAPTNSAPVFDNDNDPDTDDTDLGQINAPSGTLVHVAAGSGGTGFTDPDGDPLTLTLAATRPDATLGGTPTYIPGRIFLAAKRNCQLANLQPPIKAPTTTDGELINTVTLTAKDPDGASVQAMIDFVTIFPRCPEFESAVLAGAALTIIFDRDLNSAYGVPGGDEFEVKVDGSAVALAETDPVSRSGKMIVLTLAAAPAPSQTVTVSYVPDVDSLTTETVGDTAPAVAFADQALTNNPELTAVTVDDPTGTVVTLTFDKDLQTMTAAELQELQFRSSSSAPTSRASAWPA